MVVPLVLAVVLLLWSLVANLVIGEQLYVVRNVLVASVLVVGARATGRSWKELGLARETYGAGLRWGAGAAVAVVVAIAVGVLMRDVLPFVEALLADDRAQRVAEGLLWQTLVRIPVGTALFEEVAFRGVLMGLLLQATSTPRAVAWSSAAFGLWHVAPTIVALRINDVAPSSPSGIRAIVGAVLVTTVAGVVFAGLRLLAGNLLAPVLAHWATNASSLVAAAITDGDGLLARRN